MILNFQHKGTRSTRISALAVLALCLLMTVLSGCGQTGPLTLPQKESEQEQPNQQPAN